VFINSRKIINLMEKLAPKKLAESWDNVGLILGNDQVEIDKVMVALDITEAVVEEAVEKNVDLIITHHPLIFKGMKSITESTYHGKLIRRLIKEDIHVYAAHTNLDIATNGLNDYLATLLDLEQIELLEVTGKKNYYNVVTFVPKDNLEVLENALYGIGVGRLGNYDECGFKVSGTGSFRPLQGASPAIGAIDHRESVDEVRLESIVTEEVLSKALSTLQQAHPYETPAVHVTKLENISQPYGLGRVGRYATPKASGEVVQQLKTVLATDHIRVAGQLPDEIAKVGLCTGAGIDFVRSAKSSGCDIYITGDVKYHEAQLAEQLGICILDCGHYETENIYMDYLSQYLEKKCIQKNYEIRIIKSESLENPLKVY